MAEVDELTWEPGWVEVPLEVQRQRIRDRCAEDSWILDSAYGKWLDLPLARADLVIGLDYPRWLSLSRLVRRTFHRIRDREPVCNGNRETAQSLLSRDSILLWHFRSFARKRSRMRAFASGGELRVILLKSPAQAKELLDRWPDI